MKKALLLVLISILGVSQIHAQKDKKTTTVTAEEDLGDIIADLDAAIRVTEAMPATELPDELPRFQRANALPITLNPAQKVQWNKHVNTIETIVKNLKKLPAQMNALKRHAKRLRLIYTRATAAKAKRAR